MNVILRSAVLEKRQKNWGMKDVNLMLREAQKWETGREKTRRMAERNKRKRDSKSGEVQAAHQHHGKWNYGKTQWRSKKEAKKDRGISLDLHAPLLMSVLCRSIFNSSTASLPLTHPFHPRLLIISLSLPELFQTQGLLLTSFLLLSCLLSPVALVAPVILLFFSPSLLFHTHTQRYQLL